MKRATDIIKNSSVAVLKRYLGMSKTYKDQREFKEQYPPKSKRKRLTKAEKRVLEQDTKDQYIDYVMKNGMS